MDWLAFAGSILGGLIGGLFTYFGVRLTLEHEKEKEKEELLTKAKFEKPRLEITKYFDFNSTKDNNKINNDCNVLILKIRSFDVNSDRVKFYYDEKALNNENLIFVEYELKNDGLTEIEDICVTGNLPRNISLVELERKSTYINYNLLNYAVWANKRYIKPGQSFKLRIYYLKEEIIVSNFGNPILTIWLKDVNGRYWSQLLASPSNQIEITQYKKYSEFREKVNIDKAIECFRKPYLW